MKMKINAGRVLLALMLLTLSLAACGGDQPPPTIVPTAERSTESENEPIDTETESEPAIPAEEPTAEAPAVPTETTEAAMPESEPTVKSRAETVAQNLSVELTAQLDAFLQSQVYSDGGNPEGAAPGLVMLVDTPDGRYLNAAGVSSMEEGTPMQVDNRLEIGSNSKSFTIAVLMQLQVEG